MTPGNPSTKIPLVPVPSCPPSVPAHEQLPRGGSVPLKKLRSSLGPHHTPLSLVVCTQNLKGGTSPTLKTIHQTKLSFQKLESWGLDVRQLLSFFQRAQTHGICIISQQQLLQTTVTPPRFRGLLPPYPGATGTTLTVPLRDGALLQIPI